jgi:AraC-like DNA-binding protein
MRISTGTATVSPMVSFGQAATGAAGVGQPAEDAVVGTTTLPDLASDTAHRQPVLLDRHLLMLVTAGHGILEVDFRPHPCRPGTLIRARPGQVIRHGGQPGLDAIVLRWSAAALQPLPEALDDPFGPTSWQLAGEDEDAVINDVSQLVVDCERHRAGDLAARLLRHQLAVLLLRVALLPGEHQAQVGSPETATFVRLRQEVERSYARTRRVEDYAAAMDCSVRTLTRACLAVTGRTAKQIVDDRVALQARRLLAATDMSVAEVGRRLGFPEPTNFGRFFQREVGRSPGGFRADLRAPTPPWLPKQRRPQAASPSLNPVA